MIEFAHDGNGNYTYTLDPGETQETFMNWTEVNRFFPDATPQQFNDECRVITDQVPFTDSFVYIEEGETKTLNVGQSFLSYWSVISGDYEVLELTENRIAVRGLSEPFNGDPSLYWYFTFIPEEALGGGEDETLQTQYTNLVWADEFDVDGAPNPANWTYDLGTGDNGWGNQESQFYTDNAENVIVADNVLKITAVKSEDTASGDLYYFDDIQVSNSAGVGSETISDFEGDPAPAFTGFEGAGANVIQSRCQWHQYL